MFGNIKKIVTGLQLETYLLYILPIIGILLISLFETPPFSVLFSSGKEIFKWSFFYGGQFIKVGFRFLCIYIYFKMFLCFAQWINVTMFNGQPRHEIGLKPFFLSFIYTVFAFLFANFFMLILVQHLSVTASPDRVIATSQLFMSIDRYLFGFDPVLWIQQCSNSTILDYLLIQSYTKIFLFLAIVFFGLLLFKIDYFRQYMIAIFIALLIATPFWRVFPAISPNEMYRNNAYSLSSILAIQQEYKNTIKGEFLMDFLHKIKQSVEAPTQKHPLVATNPSMHVAWGTIIAYFGIILWWPLGFIFMPWLVLNIISTLYTLQHYAVDLPAGIACGVLAIIMTKLLFKFEKKYYAGTYRLLYFLKVVQADMQDLIAKSIYYFSKGMHFFRRSY